MSTSQYKYCVIPYSLTNSPSIFQGFMSHVLPDTRKKFVIVYIDDKLVYTTSVKENLHNVCQVL